MNEMGKLIRSIPDRPYSWSARFSVRIGNCETGFVYFTERGSQFRRSFERGRHKNCFTWHFRAARCGDGDELVPFRYQTGHLVLNGFNSESIKPCQRFGVELVWAYDRYV